MNPRERWDLPTAHWDDSHSSGDVRWPARVDVDLFAGPGGLDEGRRIAGRDDLPLLGIEWEPWACRTAHAAGHTRVRADVRMFPTAYLRGKVRLLMGSPPCTKFSAAGNGAGRLALDLFVSAIGPMLAGNDVRAWVERQHADMLREAAGDDEKAYAKADAEAADAVLVLEPARWIHDTEPQSVVLEQVPAVLPIWQALARELRARGWSVWTGVLNAADYSVPQTRRRAILIASRVRAIAPPEPTHAERPVEDLFGGERLPWVSMAEALGWGMTARPYFSLATGVSAGGADVEMLGGSGARESYRRERASGRWVVQTGNNSMVTGRTGSRAGDGDVQRYERPITEPAPTLDTNVGAKWTVTRPATTVQGDPRIAPPGHRDRQGGERAFPEGTVRITVTEAATLQGFRPDYPWQGNRTSAFGQVGNAVPPPLAAVCVTAALGPPPLAAGAAPARQEAP